MKLFLIRHPEPDVEKGFCYGKLDVPIVSSWERDAEHIGRWFDKPSFNGIRSFHSPLSRAEKLATRVFGNSLPVDEIAELDFGKWEGQNWGEIPKSEIDEWSKDLQFSAPYEGESLDDLRQRVMPRVEELIESVEKNDHVALFTHSGVIKVIVSVLCQWPISECHRINIGYSSITGLTVYGPKHERYVSLDRLGAGDWVD